MSKDSKATEYDFKKLSSKDWWNKIDQDLKGKPREKLFTNLVGSLKTKPFYHFDQEHINNTSFQYQKRDRSFLSDKSWLLGQKFFIDKSNEETIAQLLKESIQGDTDFIELNFINQFNSRIIIDALDSYKGKLLLTSDNLNCLNEVKETFSKSLSISIISDPDYSNLVINEKKYSGYSGFIDDLSIIPVNSGYFISKGANEIQEAVFTLSVLNHLIQSSQEKKKASKFLLRLNTGSNLFLQIAKFRSIRKLASFILTKWELDSELLIEAQSSIWNKSVYDRFTNILRLSSESFAAIVGGADILNISGFEESLKIENNFTHRNARNISHLLKHESHLDKVKDLAAGSYFVENLSLEYSERVWEGFQEIEKAGGIVEYNEQRNIESLLMENRRTDQKLFGEGKIKMVGTNSFPNPLDELTKGNIKNRQKERLAFNFEKLRASVDLRSIEDASARPQAILLKLGSSEMRFARSGFSRNYLESAGIRIKEGDEINQELSKADLAVLCASDEDYIANGMEWVKKVKTEFPKVKLIIAGNPQNRDELQKAGLDFFIHLKAPLEITLSEILKSIGIEKT